MAQLKDLLSSTTTTQVLELIGQSEQKDRKAERKRVMREVARRKALSYRARMEELAHQWHAFDDCQERRPSKRKVQNRFSREEAGTKGRITMGIRTGNYGVVVCKSENKW